VYAYLPLCLVSSIISSFVRDIYSPSQLLLFWLSQPLFYFICFLVFQLPFFVRTITSCILLSSFSFVFDNSYFVFVGSIGLSYFPLCLWECILYVFFILSSYALLLTALLWISFCLLSFSMISCPYLSKLCSFHTSSVFPVWPAFTDNVFAIFISVSFLDFHSPLFVSLCHYPFFVRCYYFVPFISFSFFLAFFCLSAW
jgi:hypothetical protein